MNSSHLIELIWIVSCILSGGYLLFLFLILFFHKNTSAGTAPIEGVSVIIAAHNELNNLRTFLPSILDQQYPAFEVIIACDRCEDGSLDYLSSIAHPSFSYIEIKDIEENLHPKKRALTLAINKASYQWILLTDADCKPATNNWIQTMMEAKGNKQVCLGLSFYTGSFSVLNTFIRFETLFTAMQYASWALMGKPYMGVGRNLLYAKDLFINNSGFGKHGAHLGGDDDLLIQSLATKTNTTVCMLPGSFTLSPPPKGWKEWWNQKHRHLNAGKQYPLPVLIGLSIYPIFSILFYSLGLFYSFSSYFPIGIILYILRTCIFIITFAGIGHKWKYSVCLLFLPVLEIKYLFYLIFAGCYNLAVPIKKWK